MSNKQLSIDAKCVNTIKALTLDAVYKANSGHSGTAMALAPVTHVLFSRIMNYDPKNPRWENRDRFVLSAGHASMLMYSILHLTGYDVSLDDIKNFRQWGSKTPGHPEAHHTDGVEVTTGPLGQGFANAVGMALAQEYLSNICGKDVIDHNIFVLCSDGDLMEGISYEAASFAGHNKLSKLIAIYDDNKITIDGQTDLTFSENVEMRFKSQGWNVINAGEISEDLDAIEKCINEAKSNTNAPTIIILRTHIGYPSPNFTDTSAAHGAITDAQDIAATKQIMGSNPEEFIVDPEIYDYYRNAVTQRSNKFESWSKATSGNDILSELSTGTNSKIDLLAQQELTKYFDDDSGENTAPSTGDMVATRVSCSQILSTFSRNLETILGGSADLTSNTGTKLSKAQGFSPENTSGRQIHFGIREHSMAAIANGMALGYGLRPFVGTFLVFADYMRPSIRLAALSKARTLFVFSHDSIGVGEDGPTHQPIEQLAALRAIPEVQVLRPADGYETAAAIENHFTSATGPTCLILTRQNIPTLKGTKEKARVGVRAGAYTLIDCDNPNIVLAASGSEVHLCVQAAQQLKEHSINAKVVSVPCLERLHRFNETSLNELFGINVPVVAIEAGSKYGWDFIADETIGLDRFGASAPGDEVFSQLGITTQAIIDASTKLLSK